ncbi:MAG: tetratricopeptide repeat protein [Myxococcota bacterium]|jgi:tetratricopeptide (TPR) repeat protein|nr:tetratricopeptide repeat protein [Myxococcota bacterium]
MFTKGRTGAKGLAPEGQRGMMAFSKYASVVAVSGVLSILLLGSFQALARDGAGRAERKKKTPIIASEVSREPTPEEISALEAARETDMLLYVSRVQDFRGVVDGMVQRVYRMRREHIDKSFQDRIVAEEALVESARKSAIAYFEEFLRKYPSAPPYTPDAMYRLAELYYDDSYIKYLDASQEYGDRQEKGLEDETEPPMKEFDRSIALFRELIVRYPEYRNIDGVYYLLGYILNETAREDEARIAWLSLVCANKFQYDPVKFEQEKAAKPGAATRPSANLDTGVDTTPNKPFVDPFVDCKPVTANSRFFFETWWLVGNYHFDYDISRHGVETAIAAYKKLIQDPKHKFYDKGLYKLAWSYFKADRYPEAIEAFTKVVDYSDAHVDARRSGMRPEAIQYLAVCFFTEDWNGDNLPDSVAGIDRLQDGKLMPQDREWTREVYLRLGAIFSDNEKNQEAIAVYELYLKKWPLDVQAPFVQEKIALEYNKMRDFESEIKARAALDSYGPESAWWKANANRPIEQNEVARMARDALLEMAYHRHRTAQALRQEGLVAQDAALLERAIKEYNLAAQAYRKFISQNPDIPDAYDITFNLAETLFWSGQYEAARKEYTSVRDSNLDDKFRADAANMVVVSLDKIIEQQIKAGKVDMRAEAPKPEGTPLAVAPIPMPELLTELMKERETLIAINPQHKDAGKFKYQSAQNFFRYGFWDEANKRYELVYNEYCKTDPIAYVSWQTMMNMATDMGNLNEKERLALMQQEKQCTVDGVEKLGGDIAAIDIGTVLGDVAMQRALEKFKTCMDKKEAQLCTTSADDLVAAVNKAPQHPSADAALHNAALAYELAQRFNSAMQIYGRIIAEYPKSPYVGKCLFQQGLAAQKFFEYEKALDNYRVLADEKRFADYENRTVSIYNSADILTNLQSYNEAVPYWQRYAREEKDPAKKLEAEFNAADMYFRAKKWKQAIKSYDDFIKRYNKDKTAGPLVVKAAYRIAKAQAENDRKAKVAPSWRQTISHYDALVNEPGSMSAEYAAESAFLLVEEDMRAFESFQIKGAQKVIDQKIKEGAQKVKSFEERYRDVQKYRRPEWSLAAECRIGYAYEVFAKALLNVPFPPLDKESQKMLKQLPQEDRDLVMVELEDKFRAAMEQQVAPMEEKAQSEYKIAVDLARKGNISNDWTLLALERLNAYDPDTYPRQHNGVVLMQDSSLAGPQWASEAK